jgi:hypothetical protein
MAELSGSLLTPFGCNGLCEVAVRRKAGGLGETARSDAVRVRAAARSMLASAAAEFEPRLNGTEVKNDCPAPSGGELVRRESKSEKLGDT